MSFRKLSIIKVPSFTTCCINALQYSGRVKVIPQLPLCCITHSGLLLYYLKHRLFCWKCFQKLVWCSSKLWRNTCLKCSRIAACKLSSILWVFPVQLRLRTTLMEINFFWGSFENRCQHSKKPEYSLKGTSLFPCQRAVKLRTSQYTIPLVYTRILSSTF